MTLFRKVADGTWGDERFASLSDDAKLLWFYFLTGPEVTSLPGVLLAGRAHLIEAMGWEAPRFDAAFGELAKEPEAGSEHDAPMVKADWKARVVLLPKGWKHNPPANPNVVIGWRDFWRRVPECALKREAEQILAAFCERLGESYINQFRNHIGTVRGTIPPTVTPTVPKTVSDTVPRTRAQSPAPASAPAVSEGVQGEPGRESAPYVRGTSQPIPPDLPLTDMARASAEMLGVRDIDLEWRTFVAHYRSTAELCVDWYAKWEKWLPNAKKFQQRDRARDAARVQPAAAPAVARPDLRRLDAGPQPRAVAAPRTRPNDSDGCEPQVNSKSRETGRETQTPGSPRSPPTDASPTSGVNVLGMKGAANG